jgi:hypothetical protein
MKSENRITDFITLDMGTNPTNPSVKDADQQGIVRLLTNEIGRLRTEVEKLINTIAGESQKIKLIEIIVDNLPYHNNFISFPQDLTPIKNRDDMNLVWKGIEEDLVELFPKQFGVTPPTDSKKYLKLVGMSVLSCVVVLLFFGILFQGMTGEILTLLAIFSFFLPLIIFLLHKKNLELFPSLTEEPRRISGAINWNRLFRKTGTALVLFLEVYIVLSVVLILIYKGSFQYTYPAFLAVFITLLILFYRSKRGHVQENKVQLTPLNLLKFFVVSLVSILVCGASWASILLNLPGTLSDSQFDSYNYYLDRDTYIFTLTILTTICLLILRQGLRRRKQFPFERVS